ncbi:MAG: aromatic ring-hydroxylating dioxygenase subunit alpha [Rhodospirillaceae bacterium]|nr:MAG: aromatic ring-hydroxylating dioxygenase subunit alpha [Rhodospirillaceae bacterium]
MNEIGKVAGTAAEKPVVIPVEAYVSEAYARAESDKLWAKVWQVACRVEEIPKVGDYVTYDILDESIIVVRSAPDKITAYYNVCQHRGRRLTEGCGQAKQFRCKFHGWAWGLDGKSTHVLDPQDWGKSLTPENLRLKEVKVGTWGGWVWINMDPNCQPLQDYLEPAVSMLDPFEFEKMRYGWRQWLYVACNWKVALEAFNESYHVDGTHPQFTKWGSTMWWSKAENNCGYHGRGAARGEPGSVQGGTAATGELMAAAGQDPRLAAADYQNEIVRTLNAATTDTFVKAANRLADELPPGTPFDQVNAHFMASAERDDAARGVIWPKIDLAHMTAVGHDWHIFPNTIILFGQTFALCYRARPNGYDPNSCIFEVYHMERFPEGQEPKTEWVYSPEPTEQKWLKILTQDFTNMPQMQKGMKSRGFAGPRPGPVQEVAVIHFHRLLAKYMGTGAPQPIA